jgi:putative endonuclease
MSGGERFIQNMKFYYTYVLKCRDGKMYIGSTSDLQRRHNEHLTGSVGSTKNRRPLELIYYEACPSKKSAQQREQYFKTGFGRAYLKKRISKK